MYVDESVVKVIFAALTFIAGLLSGAYGRIREREKTRAFHTLLESRLSDNIGRLDSITQDVHRATAKSEEVYGRLAQIGASLSEITRANQLFEDSVKSRLRQIDNKVSSVIEIVHDMHLHLSKVKGTEIDRDLQRKIDHIRNFEVIDQ